MEEMGEMGDRIEGNLPYQALPVVDNSAGICLPTHAPKIMAPEEAYLASPSTLGTRY